MPRIPLISGNGNADEHANQQTQLQGTLVTTVTTVVFWRWAMEMENETEGLHPGPSCRIYYTCSSG